MGRLRTLLCVAIGTAILGCGAQTKSPVENTLDKISKEFTRYTVALATDMHGEDSRPDLEGYIQLFKKLKVNHENCQTIEQYKTTLDAYIDNISSEQQYERIINACCSMFSERDKKRYQSKVFETKFEMSEGMIEDLMRDLE